MFLSTKTDQNLNNKVNNKQTLFPQPLASRLAVVIDVYVFIFNLIFFDLFAVSGRGKINLFYFSL